MNTNKTTDQFGFESHTLRIVEALSMLASEIEILKGMIVGSADGSINHPLFNNNKMPYPYKEARLIIPDSNSKDQRWLIKYYAWDNDLEKLVMVRERDINQIKDLRKRRIHANARVLYINELLRNGKCIDRVKEAELKSLEKAQTIAEEKKRMKSSVTLKVAVDSVIQRKSRKSEATQRDYANIRKYFYAWLDKRGKGSILLSEFDLEMARDYLHYFVAERNASNRYHNNIKMYLGTIFRELELNEYPVKNHFAKIPKLKEGIGRNHAYDTQQQIKIREVAQKNFPALVPVIETLFYTLMRESELVRLQVKDIYAYHPNKIYLPGWKSKNRQERHIEVTEELARVFEEMKVKESPPDYFVFSDNTLTPGPKMYSVVKLGKRYWSNVKKKLPELGNQYTLYSWKHTGVTMAKLAGIPDAYIMMQGGWQDVSAYNKYLKSLGLLDNSEFRKKMPVLGQSNSQRNTGP